jgi:hypothetical protein
MKIEVSKHRVPFIRSAGEEPRHYVVEIGDREFWLTRAEAKRLHAGLGVTLA